MAHNGNGRNGHAVLAAPMTYEELRRDQAARVQTPGRGWAPAALVLGLLFLIGIVGLILRIAGGFGNRSDWAYTAATMGFLLSTVAGAPVVAIITRLVKAQWGRPIRRLADLWALALIAPLILFIFTVMTLPPVGDTWTKPTLLGRLNIWFDWPFGAPRLWDAVIVGALVLGGLGLLLVESGPDLRYLTARGIGWGRALGPLARYFVPSMWNYNFLRRNLNVLGGLYVAVVIGVATFIGVDFAMSLTPGWRSAIFGPYVALTTFEGGLATVILTCYVLRRAGYAEYIGLDQFWAMSKLLFSVAMLWFYFTWSDFIIVWYGRTPREIAVLEQVYFGANFTPFVLTFLGCFLLPWGILVINKFRHSILGPVVASGIVLLGLLFDRVRIYVSSFNIPSGNPTPSNEACPVLDVTCRFIPLDQLRPPLFPNVVDLMIMIGFIAGAVFLYLIAMRLVPVISLWEYGEGLLLKLDKTFLRTLVRVIGKPQ